MVGEIITSYKELLILAHVFGAVIGAGGAYASDLMFFRSIKDSRLSSVELSFMKIGSKMVWTGLLILTLSGALIFWSDVDHYLESDKFLAKMSIVAVIVVNGLIFHLSHLPSFRRHADHHFPSSDEFVRKSPYLMASGAVSVLSWTWALTLGTLHNISYSYGYIMTTYFITIVIAIVISLLIRKKFLGLH